MKLIKFNEYLINPLNISYITEVQELGLSQYHYTIYMIDGNSFECADTDSQYVINHRETILRQIEEQE